AAPAPSDVTCVKPELMKKPKKNQGKSSEGDNLYSEVKKNTDKDITHGPSDVTCVKPELIKLKDPKKNQDAAPGPSNVPYAKPELKKLNPGKSSDGADDMFSELKRVMEK
ncbi:Fc receptor-like protein 5, partial [Clarias magur]